MHNLGCGAQYGTESDDPLIAVKNAEFEFAEGTSIDTITFTGYDKLNSLLFFRPSQCSMLKFVYKPGSALFTSAKKKLTEEQKDLIKSEIARYSGEGTEETKTTEPASPPTGEAKKN